MMSRTIIHRLRVAMIALAIASLFGLQASAGLGRTITVPDSGTIPRSGLKISFAFEGCSSNGLRPVAVTIHPIAGAFRRDRDIQVELSVGNYGRTEFVANKVFHVQSGDTIHRDFIYIPIRTYYALRASVDTYEDGRRRRDLCVAFSDTGIAEDSQYLSPPSVLVIDFDAPAVGRRNNPAEGSDSKLPDLRRIHDVIRRQIQSQRADFSEHDFDETWTDKEILRSLSRAAYLDILNPTDLLDEWISLSGVDVVLLSWSDLQRVKVELPNRWAAVRAWAFTGGNVVLYGVDGEFEELAAIEQHFELAPVGPDKDDLGWSRRLNLDRRLDVSLMTGEESDESTPAKRGTPNFVVRSIGLGKIAAIGDEFPFPGESDQWVTLFNTLPSFWEQRHGVSWDSENEGFWEFVLPGLGLPPVNLFRVWIVIFVLAIGPLNYFVLKRSNRLSWMLITIPLAALLTTLGLVTYALVTDGLGVRYRVRSVTHIDQTSGMAATWARQVYYAGITPSGGLSFPRDAVAIPIVQSPNLEFGTNERRITWSEGEQRLTGGYMESRVMSQFLVLRSRETPLRIEVSNVEGAVTVKNQLGTAIREFYLIDDDGVRWGSESLCGAGETFALAKRPDSVAVERRLGQILNACPLRVPEGIDVTAVRDLAQMNGTYYYYRNRNATQTTGTSLLEKHIAAATHPTRAGKSKDVAETFLRPRTYVAIVDGCGEVPIGVEGAEQDSLYIITGAW